MRDLRWFVVVLLFFIPFSSASAFKWRYRKLLKKTNQSIQGQVLDFTANHGKDNRLWSKALCKRRDLYVYVPPHFDLKKKYPLMIWLHGFAQDEVSFLEHIVPELDRAIRNGCIPPTIIAAPDGTFNGRACMRNAGSFYLNSKAGKYEDYLMRDVWCFLHQTFPIRPEREAHVLAGVSMGGHAAYNKGFKYRHLVKNILGIYPPLNDRWISCRGRYHDNFTPETWAWRTDFSNRWEGMGRFYLVLTFRLGQIIKPLYGRAHNTAELIALDNPIEMIDRLKLRPGQLDMFVAYGGKDEFNIDAQIESFLYRAKRRGLRPRVVYDPEGRHDVESARNYIPDALRWLDQKLKPYAP